MSLIFALFFLARVGLAPCVHILEPHDVRNSAAVPEINKKRILKAKMIKRGERRMLGMLGTEAYSGGGSGGAMHPYFFTS